MSLLMEKAKSGEISQVCSKKYTKENFCQRKILPFGFAYNQLPQQCLMLYLCSDWDIWFGADFSSHSLRTASVAVSLAIHEANWQGMEAAITLQDWPPISITLAINTAWEFFFRHALLYAHPVACNSIHPLQSFHILMPPEHIS